MKIFKRVLSVAILFSILQFTIPINFSSASIIETYNYGWTLGKYEKEGSYIYTPSNTTILPWNGMFVRTKGPYNIYVEGRPVGSIIAFVDKDRNKDNGYLMVGEPQWDKWIEFFNGNADYVLKYFDNHPQDVWTLDTPGWDQVRFANFAQLAQLCGGKGGEYDIWEPSSIFYRSVDPYTTLLVDKQQVEVGDTVTFELRAQTNTYWSQYLDIGFAGAGKNIIDKRYNEKHPIITKTVTMDKEGTFKFYFTARDSAWRSSTKTIEIAVGSDQPPPPPPEEDPPPEEELPPPPPPNEPPVADFSWPASIYEGEVVNVTDQSFDPDGHIVDWDWYLSPNTGATYNLGDSGGTITFSNYGTYSLNLDVTDNDGDSDDITKSITVKQPVPEANIDILGHLKQNRLVVLDSSNSWSPELYPIDHSQDEWVIEPLDAGIDPLSIKFGANSDTTQEILFKEPGNYRVKLRVHNSKYASEWASKEIYIIPDEPPIANFTVPAIEIRNPSDSSYATIQLQDKSYSLDGDIITQRIWKYKFDSDNDGFYDDETWNILDNGNNLSPSIRTNHVGKYLFELETKEAFGQPTIQTFITDADYQRSDTTTKPLYNKVSEIVNIPPTTSFIAKAQPKADVVFAIGDVDPSKASNIDNDINSYLASKLLSNNIDYKIIKKDLSYYTGNIVNDSGFEDPSDDIWWDISEADIADSQNVAVAGWYAESWGHNSVRALHIFHYSGNQHGSHWSYGRGQKLSGWTPGDTLKISGWINILEHYYGTLNIDLYGFDSNNNVVFDSAGIRYNKPTSGYIYMESEPITIPDNVQRLYVRAFADGYPSIDCLFDDIVVSKKTFKPIDQVLNDISWRDNSERFLINLSDTYSFTKTDYYQNNISMTSSFAVDYGGTGGNFADGGGQSGSSYYWAKNRYIDSGRFYPMSQISSLTFKANTGGGSSRLDPINAYVSEDGNTWHQVGTFDGSAYITGSLTVKGPNIKDIDGNSIPISKIRYFRVGNGYCVDNFYLNVSIPDSNSPSAINFANTLKNNNINYSVLGTNTNKSEAEHLISLNSGNGVFYYNNDIVTALNNEGNYIVSRMPMDSGTTVSYVLLNEGIIVEPDYSDYETDPKKLDNWYYEHDPNYLDNNSGYSFYHQKTLTNPLTSFDKVGKYDISYKAQDDPVANDLRFNNYMLWSSPTPTSIIVHRKPIADFSFVSGTLQMTDLSYDPDFQYSRQDKGIVEWYWAWRLTSSSTWTVSHPSNIPAPGDYVVHLKVKDVYGVWSDPREKIIHVSDPSHPPVAKFSWTPSTIYEGDTINFINQSYDPDGDIAAYQWTFFDPDGLTTTSTTTNPILSNVKSGVYWVTLRVWDSNGLTNAVTKSVTVGQLSIAGYVRHTQKWNENRQNYNLNLSGDSESPRGYNVFWAGEKFILTADTTDTGTSSTKAQSVTVTFPYMGLAVTLTGNADKTYWTGEMWEENFDTIPDGNYTFNFTVTYSNGIIKNDSVVITIDGDIYDYYQLHRIY